MDAKHRSRDYALPGSLPDNLPPKVHIQSGKLAKLYRELKPLAGTGPCGYRNEYLTCLGSDMLDQEARQAVVGHAAFATQYVNAVLPKWYYAVANATTMIALIKKAASTPGGTPDV